MKHFFTLTTLICLLTLPVFAQENPEVDSNETFSEEPENISNSEQESEYIPSSDDFIPPTLSIGMGTLSYFGELNKNNTLSSPLTSRVAFDISFRQPINYYLEFNISAWGGDISANERSLERNLNFKTRLYGAGMGLTYNFGNFFDERPLLEPIIGVGVEFVNFNSKTDLLSEYNVRYHYWTDGSIRDLPENSANSDDAVRIQRDYYYESDIKTSELYDLDSYENYTYGFPVTAGANLNVNDNWNFRAAMTYHILMSDLLDGIDPSSGNFVGDSKMDHLLYTNISLSYNFQKSEEIEDAYDDYINIDMTSDEDEDGVMDWEDLCLQTPFGAEVDAVGCPLDEDNDNVPNYRDDELGSAPGAHVDSLGVTYTDDFVNLFYERFYDTTGTFSPITAEAYSVQVIAGKVTRSTEVKQTRYAVAIGEFEGEIPAELVNDILSVQDVNTHETNGKIVVTVGLYNSIADAESRQVELHNESIQPTYIVKIDRNNNIIGSSDASQNTASLEQDSSTGTGKISKDKLSIKVKKYETQSEEIIYRVQVGAFTKKADASKFRGLPHLITVTSDDGYIRYYTGSYSTYKEAAKAKIDILIAGFKGAFVTAFRGGNKVSLNNLNSSELNKSQTNGITSNTPLTADQKSNLKFKVQLGSYRNQIPTAVLEKYMELGSVEQLKGKDKFIRYVAGSFATYDEATAYKKELLAKGYEGCYVVGVYFGKLVSAGQAIKMLNK